MSTPTSITPRITEGRDRSRHGLVIYLVLAFALSWWPWPLAALNPESSPMVPFGPLIAALVATALSGGRHAVGRLVAQLFRWPGRRRWSAAALLVPWGIMALAAVLTRAFGGSMAGSGATPEWTQVVVTFGSTLVLVGLFEEVGWRGYALPHLQQHMSGLRAALLLGVVWASWHLPSLISDPTRQRPALPFLILVVAQSVFLSWLYNSSACSLALVVISHGMIDTAARFTLPTFTEGSHQSIWWIMTSLWAAVAALVGIASGPNLSHR